MLSSPLPPSCFWNEDTMAASPPSIWSHEGTEKGSIHSRASRKLEQEVLRVTPSPQGGQQVRKVFSHRAGLEMLKESPGCQPRPLLAWVVSKGDPHPVWLRTSSCPPWIPATRVSGAQRVCCGSSARTSSWGPRMKRGPREKAALILQKAKSR